LSKKSEKRVKRKASKCLGMGVLITHGTDTMSWGFSSLRYMIKDLDFNIVVTGSQKPMIIEYSSSDANENIKNSLLSLVNLKPPNIVMVFNFGRTVFGSRIEKTHKWDPDAFIGREMARIAWDELEICHPSIKIKKVINPIEKLHLVRTGGTIESTKGEAGGLVPGADFVPDFLNQPEQRKYFREFESHKVITKDSSDMILKDWITVGRKIEEISKNENSRCYCDCKFEDGVKLITANPLFKSKDYLAFLDLVRGGMVIAGYGAGNANTSSKGGYSIIPMIKEARKRGVLVIMTSQVLQGVYDFEYETGLKPIQEGGIPSGDLPPSECLIKLAYILGHKDEIKKAAKKYDVDELSLKESIFLAGVSFRTKRSEENYLKIRQHQIVVLDYNPLLYRRFDDAIKIIARALKKSRGKILSPDEQYEDLKTSFDLMERDLRKIRNFTFDAQLFIAKNITYEDIDHVRIMLARAFLRTHSKWDAEVILNNVRMNSKYYNEAKQIRLNIQKDSDNDGWCDAIEIELGSDPYDPNSTPV